MRKPLAIDLYCGLGGWTEGLLAEGWEVIGFDIEAHEYGGERYPAQLVLQDVLTLDGAQFAGADLIVGSSPCQAYSYMAMPWTKAKAKAKAAAIRADESGEALRALNALFDAQFRIQRAASAAAGRHIPMVVENVRGAQEWVGPAKWNFGSYYLWGDVPALMPNPRAEATNLGGLNWVPKDDPRWRPGQAFTGTAEARMRADDGRKNAGFRFDGSGRSFQSESVARHVEGQKMPSDPTGRSPAPGNGARFIGVAEGRKGASGAWFNDHKETGVKPDELLSYSGSKSPARKAAAAKIAKIPFALSSHIARVYRPRASVA